MEKLTVLDLIKRYQVFVKDGKVQFLKKGSDDKKEVLLLVNELLSDFEEAQKNEGDLSENLDWYQTHNKGRDLWKKLASVALNSIDKGSKGNSRLYEFLEKAIEFEDLLYGLEEYYRDHTLHSLWVYFIGEQLLRGQLVNVYNNLDWHIYNHIELDKADYSPKLVKEANAREQILRKSVNVHKDAIWCIMALCHDLGYSLAKLEDLNEKVKDVLKFYDLPDFNRLGYSLNIEHQFSVSQFLELVSMDVRLVPSANNKEVLIKSYRDDSTYWWLCRALEKKQHGILSSLLLYKILGIFADSWVRGPAEEWGLDDNEVKDNIICGEILFAIAQHEYEYAHLCYLGSLADVLAISDEIEEFSRYGRQMLSRKYHDTMAEVEITISPKNPKISDDVKITMHYEVKRSEDLKEFFKRKAERLCKFYSLDQYDAEHTSRIKSIKMISQHSDELLTFELSGDAEHKGFLPAVVLNGKSYDKKEYGIEFMDDVLLVLAGKIKIPLVDWLSYEKASDI